MEIIAKHSSASASVAMIKQHFNQIMPQMFKS